MDQHIEQLNQLFVPLSQAMPALAQTNQPQVLANAAAALMFIVKKEIELSGSNRARELKSILDTGETEEYNRYAARVEQTEASISGFSDTMLENNALTAEVLSQMREQIRTLGETQSVILQKLGAGTDNNGPQQGGNAPSQEPYQRTPQYNESAS